MSDAFQKAIVNSSIQDHNAYLEQSRWDRDEIQLLRHIIIALVASNGGKLAYSDLAMAAAKADTLKIKWTYNEQQFAWEAKVSNE